MTRLEDGRVRRAGKWDAYVAGTRVPHRMVGKGYAVELAEVRFPGTARVFESRIWDVLKGGQESELTPTEIVNEARRWDEAGRRCLVQAWPYLERRNMEEAATWIATPAGPDAFFLLVVALAFGGAQRDRWQDLIDQTTQRLAQRNLVLGPLVSHIREVLRNSAAQMPCIGLRGAGNSQWHLSRLAA